MDCIFCKIINGDIPSYKIYEDEYVLAFLDINPVNVGHTLVIPKVHTLDITTIDNETLMKIVDAAKKVADILVSKLDAKGFTLQQNNGIVQEVKHFHLHVIPKYDKNKKMTIEEVYKLLTN